MCLPSAQYGFGGGLNVDVGGVANLDGCNVFSNEADVRPPYAPSLRLCTGGGLFVADGGVANLDGCNVFSNKAAVRPALCHTPEL